MDPHLDPRGPKTHGPGSAPLLQRVLTKVSQTLYPVVQEMKKPGSCGKKSQKYQDTVSLIKGIQLLLLLFFFAGDGQGKGHDQPAVSRHVQVGCPGLDFSYRIQRSL